jgi:actin-related protein 4
VSLQVINQSRPASNATIPCPPLASAQSISQLCLDAVQSADADLQSLLLGNIVVVGGTTLIPGFVERLNVELSNIAQGVRY